MRRTYSVLRAGSRSRSTLRNVGYFGSWSGEGPRFFGSAQPPSSSGNFANSKIGDAVAVVYSNDGLSNKSKDGESGKDNNERESWSWDWDGCTKKVKAIKLILDTVVSAAGVCSIFYLGNVLNHFGKPDAKQDIGLGNVKKLKDRSIEEQKNLYEGAKNDIFLFTNRTGQRLVDSNIWDCIIEQAKKGIKIRILFNRPECIPDEQSRSREELQHNIRKLEKRIKEYNLDAGKDQQIEFRLLPHNSALVIAGDIIDGSMGGDYNCAPGRRMAVQFSIRNGPSKINELFTFDIKDVEGEHSYYRILWEVTKEHWGKADDIMAETRANDQTVDGSSSTNGETSVSPSNSGLVPGCN